MAYDRYARVIAWAAQQPWALQPSKLLELRAFLALKAEGMDLTPAEIQARIGAPRAAAGTVAPTGIVVLPVAGVIAHRMNLMSEISGGTSTEQLEGQLRAAAADPSIGTIVLDVDSPGGGVFGVPELAQTIREVRTQKPVVAVVNALAASAAYWLASAATEVVATPSAQVGSIGVFALHQDTSKALEAEGVSVSVISAGTYKTETLPFAPLSDEARAALQAQVDTYYGMFVRDVAQGRKVTVADVRNGFGEGRTVGAKAALEAGMVDRIATLDVVLGELVAALPASGPKAETVTVEIHAEAVAAVGASEPSAPAPFVSRDLQRRRERLAALTGRTS